MKEKISMDIEIPEKVEVKADNGDVSVKGEKGELNRKFFSRKLNIEVKDSKVLITSKKPGTKREKTMAGTFRAHIKNMIKGVSKGHVYKLKICSGHFPMNVEVKGDELIVKNYLGETIPRKLKLNQSVNVKIEGSDIVVESPDKELAGLTASSIEKLTQRIGFDKRIFQDGIYIYNKDGKEIQ